MLLPWPVAALPDKPIDAKVRLSETRLYTVPAANESTWAEVAVAAHSGRPLESQRSLLPEQPEYNKDRDGRWPEGRPSDRAQAWLVATAIERNEVGAAAPQRMVAVGANWWFFDKVSQPQVSIDGRTAAAHPGNTELFESSVYWLAGMDDLIAQSPSAQAVPIVQPMDTKGVIRRGTHHDLRRATRACCSWAVVPGSAPSADWAPSHRLHRVTAAVPPTDGAQESPAPSVPARTSGTSGCPRAPQTSLPRTRGTPDASP